MFWISIFVVIAGLSLFVLFHEGGHFFAAKAFGIKAEEFGLGFPPRIWSRKRGETVYSVNALPFGGFVRLLGEEAGGEPVAPDDLSRSFRFRPAWERVCVFVAGVAANFLAGWLLLAVVLMIGAPQAVIVTGTQKGSPAEEIGLQEGDVIVGYKNPDMFIGAVNAHAGQPFMFEVRHGEKTRIVTVTPRTELLPGGGRIGASLADGGIERHGLIAALREGLREAVAIIGLVYGVLYGVLRDAAMGAPDFSGIMGPLGVVAAAGEVGQLGLVYVLHLLALISLNLAALNILPFPALDGGGVALLALEKIRGIPLSVRLERAVTAAGFATLLFLMIAITARDVLML